MDEIKRLIGTDTIVNIFLKVANQNNIVLFKKEPLKTVRQQPPAAPIKKLLNKPVDFFILTSKASNYIAKIPVVNKYKHFSASTFYISTFNIGESIITYNTMIDKSISISTLFKGVFPKFAICTAIDNSNLRDFVGIILESNDDYLLFAPFIHDNLRYLFTPFSANTNVFFKNIGCGLDQNSSEVLYKYSGSTDLNTTT
jgi:hypothetical protein